MMERKVLYQILVLSKLNTLEKSSWHGYNIEQAQGPIDSRTNQSNWYLKLQLCANSSGVSVGPHSTPN